MQLPLHTFSSMPKHILAKVPGSYTKVSDHLKPPHTGCGRLKSHSKWFGMDRSNDAQTDILPKKCKLRSKTWWFTKVAIHISYRTLLRSSSLQEPRDPLLKVVYWFMFVVLSWYIETCCVKSLENIARAGSTGLPTSSARVFTSVAGARHRAYTNDPSAGSPTDTLLRLLLPLNDQVWPASRELLYC